MLKVFIMEDNLQQLNNLQAVVKTILLKLQVTDSLVLPFSSTTSLNKALPEPSADNVFILDLQINHNKRAGLQLSQLIRQRDPEASIIFITVHDELLYTTYKYRVQALDFISKDQDNIEQELMKDFRLITRQHQKKAENLFHYTSYNQDQTILLDDICFFKSNKDNTHSATIFTNDNRAIEIHQNRTTIANNDSRFIRVHRSYLVNPHTVKNVDFYHRQIEFYNGMTCPIARRKAKSFFALVRQYKHPADEKMPQQERG